MITVTSVRAIKSRGAVAVSGLQKLTVGGQFGDIERLKAKSRQ